MNCWSRTKSNIERLQSKSFFKKPISVIKNPEIINLKFQNSIEIGVHTSAGASRRTKDYHKYTYSLEEYTKNKHGRKNRLTITFNKPKLKGSMIKVSDTWNKKSKWYIII